MSESPVRTPPAVPPPVVTPRPPAWTLHPASAGLLALTDLVAAGADAAAIPTGGLGYVFVLLIACAASTFVFLVELGTTKRFLASAAKGVAAWILVALPTPIAGLVGAGASFLGRRSSGPRA